MPYPHPTIRLRIARLLFSRKERHMIAHCIRQSQMEAGSLWEKTNPEAATMIERLWATFKTDKP